MSNLIWFEMKTGCDGFWQVCKQEAQRKLLWGHIIMPSSGWCWCWVKSAENKCLVNRVNGRNQYGRMNVPVSVSMVTAHLAVYMAVTDGGVLYNVQAARCIYVYSICSDLSVYWNSKFTRTDKLVQGLAPRLMSLATQIGRRKTSGHKGGLWRGTESLQSTC